MHTHALLSTLCWHHLVMSYAAGSHQVGVTVGVTALGAARGRPALHLLLYPLTHQLGPVPSKIENPSS